MKRVLLIASLSALAISALTTAPASKIFESTYSIKSDSTLGKAKCGVCHATKMGGKKLNAYGLDLQKAMHSANLSKITPELLHKLDGVDSNKNGTKNADDIRADKMPG